jgi:tetratricopeptide (TPR) repeat protein
MSKSNQDKKIKDSHTDISNDLKDLSPNRLEIPRIEKNLGDVKISEKNYEDAISHYKNSIMALKILFDDEKFSEDEKKATEIIENVGIPVHLNLAFCYLQLQDWINVEFYCTKVLELKPQQLKALYRRCKAYLNLKKVYLKLT